MLEPIALPIQRPIKNTARIMENAYVVAPNRSESSRVHTTSAPSAVRPERAIAMYIPVGFHDARLLATSFAEYGTHFESTKLMLATMVFNATAVKDEVGSRIRRAGR